MSRLMVVRSKKVREKVAQAVLPEPYTLPNGFQRGRYHSKQPVILLHLMKLAP